MRSPIPHTKRDMHEVVKKEICTKLPKHQDTDEHFSSANNTKVLETSKCNIAT